MQTSTFGFVVNACVKHVVDMCGASMLGVTS